MPLLLGKTLQKILTVEQHCQLKQLCLVHLDWNLFKRVVSIKIGLLKVRPLEIFLESKLVFESESLVRISALLPRLIIKNQKETSVDVVLIVFDRLEAVPEISIIADQVPTDLLAV